MRASDDASPRRPKGRRGTVFRDGKVHVQLEMCKTCIFRPGNLMHLEPGRLREMVDGAKANDSAIICHDTIGKKESVCRGFFERYPTQPLQVAERLGFIEWT